MSQGVLIPEVALICDDIRKEDNGKLLFVGVYSDTMTVLEFPATLPRLSCAIYFRAEATGPFEFTAALIDPNAGKVFEVKGGGDYQGPTGRNFWVPIPGPPIILPVAGSYVLRVHVNGEPKMNQAFEIAKGSPSLVFQQQPRGHAATH